MAEGLAQNVTGIVTYLQWVNNQSQNTFGWQILVLIFSFIFIGAHAATDTTRAFGAAALLTALLSIGMYVFELIAYQWLIGFCILGALGGFALVINNASS